MLRSWILYIRESFAPIPHAVFAALWYVAAWASVHDRVLAPGWPLALGVVHAFFMLLALRVVDDVKDLEHDRRHHPERPLASGRVTLGEARGLLAACGGVLLGVNLLLGSRFLAVAAVQLAFAVAVALARPRRWLAEVIVVQPLNVLVTLHAYMSGLRDAGCAPRPTDLAIFACFSGAILQLEVARKTAFERREGEELYSELAGPGGALVLAFGLAACASAALVINRGPLSALALVPYGVALAIAGVRKSRAILVGAALAFLAGTEVRLAIPSAREAPVQLSLGHGGNAR